MFYIAAGVAVFAVIVFDVFSSSDRAPWADKETTQDYTNTEKTVSYKHIPMNDTVNNKLLLQQDDH